MIKKYSTLVISIFFFSLLGCNSSNSKTETKVNCVITDQQVQCNGGYSYWIGSLYAVSNNVIAITGVVKSGGKSQQWISFFNSDLSELYKQHSFKQLFKADEHNAPAVIALDNNQWLVARTGHNDTFAGQGIIEITLFNEQFNVTSAVELNTKNGATYAQLVEANNKVYLLTRDTSASWGVFISEDNGLNWSNWQPVVLPVGYRTYAFIEKENNPGTEYERIIMHSGNHPLDNQQTIAYSYLDLAKNDPSILSNKSINIGNVTAKSNDNYNIQLLKNNADSTHIRFLDGYNKENNLCHLYSIQEPVTGNWQLNVVNTAHGAENKNNYVVGNFSGVLGDNSYITGASIKTCNLFDGGAIEVLVSHEVNGTYYISLVSLDAQTGEQLNTENVYSSNKQLYRPVYIKELNYIMFNEAENWNDYENWLATQLIIAL